MNRKSFFLVWLCICSFIATALSACTIGEYNGVTKRIKCSNESLAKVLDQGNVIVAGILIFESDIRRLSNDQFSRYSKSLMELNLHRCNIKDIDVDAFRGLTYLESLSLPGNNVSEVKGQWFRGLISLRQLDLSFNRIKTIESQAFESLSNLRRLDLSDNQIGCLDIKVLEPLRGLDKFRFGDNPMGLLCRAKLTLWLRDRGINYKIDRRGPEVWLDQVLWLCAMDDSIPPEDKDNQMVQCVILNLFNQLRTALTTSSPSSLIPQQCAQARKELTRCLVTDAHKTLPNFTTNGAFIKNLLLQLRESKSSA